MTSILFPETPRDFPGRRWLKIVLRAVHVLCVCGFSGAVFLSVTSAARDDWFWATVISGIVLLALDLHESGVFLIQIRGLVVLVKLIALGFVHQDDLTAKIVVAAVILLSVISSHASSTVRYRLLFGGDRFKGATSKG